MNFSLADNLNLSRVQGVTSLKQPQKHVVIMGAGPAGLTAAYELVVHQHVGVTVLEKDPRYVGGISRTVEHNGYRFDIGGHRFFSKSAEIEDLWAEIMGNELSVLAFCATGWNQVGARYVFPLYPLFFLLLAQRASPLNIRWISLAGLSIFINLLLARTFWESKPSTVFIAGSAGIVLIGCILAIIVLRRQGQQQEEIAALAPAMIPAEVDVEPVNG